VTFLKQNNMIKSGDILAVHGEGGISQLIEFGKQLQEPELFQSKIPSHIAPIFTADQQLIDVIIKKFQTLEGREFLKNHMDMNNMPKVGELCVIEMDEQGIYLVPLKNSRYFGATNYYIIEPIVPFSELEQKILSTFAAFYFQKEVAYDYPVYAAWFVKIGGSWIWEKITGKKDKAPWLGQRTDIPGYRDSSQWQQDCIELGERLWNWTAMSGRQRPLFWTGNVNASQPWDVLINPLMQITKDSPIQNPFNVADMAIMTQNFYERTRS
jgi:hypothetical protein